MRTSLYEQVLQVAALLCAVASAKAQLRALVPITNSAEEHVNAVLSPDATFVAFRGPDKIAVVNYFGGQETMVASGRNLAGFIWAQDSLGLYYLDGRDLNFVSRSGGVPRLVASLPETNHALWAIKNDGSDLFGTYVFVRTNGGQTIRETHVFAIATNGSGGPRVLVRSDVVIDGVQLSPDESRMVYREYDATPFSRRDYIVANIDGSSPVSLTGTLGLGLNPELPHWLRDGSGIAFSRIDRTISRLVLETLTLTNPTPTPLTFTTPARNLSVARDGRWIVYEGWWPAGATWTPMLVPSTGGGHVFLDTSRALVFAGTPMMGGAPSTQVVVSATLGSAAHAQVLKVEEVRDLFVAPRAVIGSFVDVELPAAAAEVGSLLMAAAPLPVPIALPGLSGGFQLDLATAVTLFNGVGSGSGPLRLRLPIPNVPFLQHKAVYLQALRLTSLAPSGDFTRLVELPIF
jgi:hypothetical protein